MITANHASLLVKSCVLSAALPVKWTYLYRAVDRDGQTLDFMLSRNRDTAAARRFFKRAIGTNGKRGSYSHGERGSSA